MPLLLVLLISLAASCTPGDEGIACGAYALSPPEPDAVVYPAAFDLTSDYSQRLGLVVDRSWSDPAVSSDVEEIAAHVSLRAWPEDETVQAEILTSPAADPTDPGPLAILIVPPPLDPARWYAIAYGPAASGVELPPHAWLPVGERRYVARFSTGSHPLLHSVELGRSYDPPIEMGVLLRFSERIVSNGPVGQALRIRRDGDTLRCSGSYTIDRNDPAGEFIHWCDDFPFAGELTIDVTPGGFTSLSGAPLEGKLHHVLHLDGCEGYEAPSFRLQ